MNGYRVYIAVEEFENLLLYFSKKELIKQTLYFVCGWLIAICKKAVLDGQTHTFVSFNRRSYKIKRIAPLYKSLVLLILHIILGYQPISELWTVHKIPLAQSNIFKDSHISFYVIDTGSLGSYIYKLSFLCFPFNTFSIIFFQLK